MAAAFGRLRSPAAIVTMLAAGGKETSLASAEDACEIGTSLANGVCLSSTDGLEVGSVAWVLGPQGKAARKKLPRVKIADLLRRNAPADDDGNECDISDGTMDRARCMGNYDPLSLTSAWVLRGAKAVGAARSKLPGVKLGGLWGANAANPHDEVDACDTEGDTLARGLCLDEHDALSMASSNWVLSQLAKVKSQSPKSESARSSWWSLQQRTPTIHPL
jgi:hypothetical protein